MQFYQKRIPGISIKIYFGSGWLFTNISYVYKFSSALQQNYELVYYCSHFINESTGIQG